MKSAGTHVTLDAYVEDASVFDSEKLTELFYAVVAAIDMKILMPPKFIEVPVDPEILKRVEKTGVFEDEGGITGMCVVNKSHLSLHAWPLQKFFSFDVFSCSDFDPYVVIELVTTKLGARKTMVHTLMRGKPEMPGVHIRYVHRETGVSLVAKC